jgi:hypothetical protein
MSSRLSATPLRRPDEPTLYNSTSFDSIPSASLDDLDIEDQLSRVFVRDNEFQPFSRMELAFMSVSCVGVVTVPLLYLFIGKLLVLEIQTNRTNDRRYDFDSSESHREECNDTRKICIGLLFMD